LATCDISSSFSNHNSSSFSLSYHDSWPLYDLHRFCNSLIHNARSFYEVIALVRSEIDRVSAGFVLSRISIISNLFVDSTALPGRQYYAAFTQGNKTANLTHQYNMDCGPTKLRMDLGSLRWLQLYQFF